MLYLSHFGMYCLAFINITILLPLVKMFIYHFEEKYNIYRTMRGHVTYLPCKIIDYCLKLRQACYLCMYIASSTIALEH